MHIYWASALHLQGAWQNTVEALRVKNTLCLSFANRPSLAGVSVNRPSLAGVSVNRPSLARVSVNRPSLAGVSVNRPSLVRTD